MIDYCIFVSEFLSLVWYNQGCSGAERVATAFPSRFIVLLQNEFEAVSK